MALKCMGTIITRNPLKPPASISTNCLDPGFYPGLGFYRNMSESFIFAADAL